MAAGPIQRMIPLYLAKARRKKVGLWLTLTDINMCTSIYGDTYIYPRGPPWCDVISTSHCESKAQDLLDLAIVQFFQH